MRNTFNNSSSTKEQCCKNEAITSSHSLLMKLLQNGQNVSKGGFAFGAKINNDNDEEYA
jgi:hypothetical protein